MKKTLYVSPNGFIGGAEKILVQIAELHFQNDSSNVSVLFFKHGEAEKILIRKKIQTTTLQNSFRLTRPLSLFRALHEIRKILISQKIEIIHSTMAYGHLVMSLASLGLKTKRVWFQHGPVTGILDKIASLLPVDLILFNSHFLLANHNKANFVRSSIPQKIIHLGIESHLISETTNSPILRFILVGRLSPLKGFDQVIKALKQISNEDPDLLKKTSFKIVGDANFSHEKIYQQELVKMAISLGSVLEFVPFQKDMAAIYNSSDILIQSSIKPEGFGLVLAEAMSHKLLVVGPNYGGATEILKDNETGLIFNFSKSTTEELKCFLTNLIEKFDQYQNLKLNGHKLITEKFTKENMIKEILSAYEQL